MERIKSFARNMHTRTLDPVECYYKRELDVIEELFYLLLLFELMKEDPCDSGNAAKAFAFLFEFLFNVDRRGKLVKQRKLNGFGLLPDYGIK